MKIRNCIPDSAVIQYMEAANDRKLLVSNYRRRIWLSRSTFCAGGDIFGFPVLCQSVPCILPEKLVYPDSGFVIAMLYPTHARTQDVRRLSFSRLSRISLPRLKRLFLLLPNSVSFSAVLGILKESF